VHPGDLLVVSVTFGDDGMSATASTAVDGAVSCQAKLVFCDVLPEPVCGPTTPFTPDFEGEQLDVEQIMSIIPHRYPFLLVDRLYREKVGEEGEYGQVVGMKNVTASESFFTAGRPVVAATLLLEMCAQAGCVWALERPENEGKIGYFMAIDEATMVRSVLPGTQLIIVMSELSMRRGIGVGRADIFAGETLVGSGFLKFAFVSVEG
jgi:3-hydroxymyristoyl/3-hydroxydecanoyl-(acyl carrier protein) dehydratase